MIFSELPKGARFTRPGLPGVWTKIHKEQAACGEERVRMWGFEEVEPLQ